MASALSLLCQVITIHVGPLYAYSADLLMLDTFSNPQTPPLPEILTKITTPLKADVWKLWLSYHPDSAFSEYIIQGLTNGFRIGFDHVNHACRSAMCNHPSAMNCPQVISESIAKEVAAGRLIGPFPPSHHSLCPY